MAFERMIGTLAASLLVVAILAMILMGLWGVGRSMVIFLAGLQDIPNELYESADIDGANLWNKFWNITLPLLTPSILFNLIFGIILTFQSFTNAFIATNGGQNNIELGFLLCRSGCGCRATSGSRSGGDCCGCCADTECVFEALDEFRRFEQRQSLDLFDNSLNLRHCYLLPEIIRGTFSARPPALEQQLDCEPHRS